MISKIIIGIDPDLVKSGVAITQAQQIISLDAMSFFQLIQFIEEHKHQACFHLEDVEHDKAVYRRPGVKSAAVERSIAQKVGQVKAIGRLLKQYLIDTGADFKLIKPLKGVTKRNAKKNAEYFNRLTGWAGKSNEDKRDAALLALYG